MNRILVLTGVTVFAMGAAFAQSDRNKTDRIQFTTLNGAYEFLDPTSKDLLHGYIENKVASAPEKTDMVEFHVCNTKTVLHIQFQQLKNGPSCRTYSNSLWASWMLENGKLVPSQPSATTTSVDLSALPRNLQADLKANKFNGTPAFSFPSANGTPTLGIVTGGGT